MAGLTTTGITIKDLDEVLSDIEGSQTADIDPDLNVNADSVLGQINGIVAAAIAELWELIEEVYQSAYPDTASGQSLSNIAALTGAVRQAATKAELSVRLEGTATTVVPSGTRASVAGDADSIFETTGDLTITEQGAYDYVTGTMYAVTPGSATRAFYQDAETTVSDLQFINSSGTSTGVSSAGANLPTFVVGDRFEVTDHASNNGEFIVTEVTTPNVLYVCTMWNDTPVNASAESAGVTPITDYLTIETPVGGLDAILIQADYVPGVDEETDQELRFRREQSLAQAGSSTVEAIRAAMLEVTGVDTCTVFENPTGVTVDSIPPYAIEVLVSSTAAPTYVKQDVADAVFANKPAGTETYGTEAGVPYTVTDTSGNNHSIYFSEPTTVVGYVEVALTKTTDGTYPGDADVAQAIEDWGTANLIVGNSLYSSDIVNVVADLAGVESVDVGNTFVDDDATPSPNTSLVVTSRQLITLSNTNVTVNSS